MLHLFDTLSRTVEPLDTRRRGQMSMYVCGPTVYGRPHAGHGRFSLVWDVLRRYMEWTGTSVNFVSNITDIDDKIIASGIRQKISSEAVATKGERIWWEEMVRLGVRRPDSDPHATAYVPEMLELISELVDRGYAYVGEDSVYFATETAADYGALSHQSIADLRARSLGETKAKRAPTDFALWKFAKPEEPAWDSPWGAGRPGWHTECVVMSLGLLGDGFDLHGGGIDLVFPHHENERAQALASGNEFARHWVHSGMVVAAGGEKMSKSIGNTFSLAEINDLYGPRAYRLLVLQSSYRSPITVSRDTLSSAKSAVENLDAFARQFGDARGSGRDAGAVASFRERMDDDLDMPAAVAGIFKLVREARAAAGEEAERKAATVFELFERPLGLMLRSEVDDLPKAALDKAAERDSARKERDWSRADSIRSELLADGWIVEDSPDGTTIRR